MKLRLKLALATAALTLVAAPAAATAVPYENPPPPSKPKGSPPAHAKAYGFHCQGFSKKHVKGQKGTPFSQCVKGMARADNNGNLAPGKACKGMSKKHAKGHKGAKEHRGTAFSRCVKKVVAMRKEQRALANAQQV